MKYNIKNTVMHLCITLCLGSWFLCACTSDEELIVYSEEQDEVVAGDAKSEDSMVALDDSSGVTGENSKGTESENGVSHNDSEQSVIPATIYIHVCGAVNRAGVYALPMGVRLFEAVEAAGGFSEEADSDYVNQAEVLLDGMKVQIPTKEQTKEWELSGNATVENTVFTLGENASEQIISQNELVKQQSETGSLDGKVNINVADETTLCTINGIGQGRAKAIIAYREAHGAFSSIEEIMNIDGIKNATFEKIKDQICVK